MLRVYADNNDEALRMLMGVVKNPEALSWRMYLLWGIAEEKDWLEVLTENVKNSSGGYAISAEELAQLEKKVHQIIDISISGAVTEEAFPERFDQEELVKNVEIIIERVDGGYWEVICEEEILKQFVDKNKGIKMEMADVVVSNIAHR